MDARVRDYFSQLAELPLRSEFTDGRGQALEIGDFYGRIGELLDACRRENKLMFVGNGGSASIASHMAVDFSKNAGIPAQCFNDGATLTCLGNDLGYDQVFAHQVATFGQLGDLLVAISSSGNSDNIVNAILAARSRGCRVLSMSGFGADNRLRKLGDYNVWVPSGEYGFVEIVHLALCHALLDLAMGWTREGGLWSAGDGAGEGDVKVGLAG